MKRLSIICLLSGFCFSAAHSAILVDYGFTADPVTASTVETGVTATTLTEVGLSNSINSARWDVRSNYPDTFSSSTAYAQFSISTDDPNDVFDLSGAGSGISFGTDRIFSGAMNFRVVVWEGTDNTVVGDTPLYTGPTLVTSNSNPDYITGPIASINSTASIRDLYVQLQVSDAGVSSSAYLEDTLQVQGSIVTIPEPSTITMLGITLGALGLTKLRRRR